MLDYYRVTFKFLDSETNFNFYIADTLPAFHIVKDYGDLEDRVMLDTELATKFKMLAQMAIG